MKIIAMSEDITTPETNKRSRAAKEAAINSVGLQFLRFAMPNVDGPNPFRSAAAQWVSQGKDNIEKAILAVEELNTVHGKIWSTATKCTDDCTAKLTEVMHRNTIAAFDLVHDVVTAASLPEMIQIPAAHARKQFNALASQNLELLSLAQKAAVETMKPITAAMPKVFQTPASS
jgi:hypothetical protein